MVKRCITLVLLLSFLPTLFVVRVKAQSNWTSNTFVSLGVNLMLHRGPGQHFPGIRLNASAGINAVYQQHVMMNYSLTFSLYSKTLGANLNPLVNDVQLDVVNSAAVGGCWGENLLYDKYFRTFNTGAYYNVLTNTAWSALAGTNFVINNHKRNQFVGNITISSPSVTLTYYNDGAPPVSWFSLGDEFDRWWTGGVGIFIHTNKNYNLLEITFDQFTGYRPQLYEMSNLLGIDVPVYENESVGKQKVPPDYNTSAYAVRYFFSQGLCAEVGVVGSLRTPKDRAFGLQDIIHSGRGFALHPNHDINRIFIGGNYIYGQ
jgi:hypothetical protein